MVRTAFEAAGAALLGLVLALRISDGSMLSLVQAWYEPVMLGTALLLLVVAVAAVLPMLRAGVRWRPVIGPRVATIAGLAAAPIVIGMVVSPEPLGGASLDDGDSSQSASLLASAESNGRDPTQRNIFEWAYVFGNDEPATIIGEPVDVIGFVYHREGAPPGQFEVARFVVACCVADAAGYTLPVQWPESAGLSEDQWVRVTGTIATDAAGALTVLASGMESIDAPANPYIYP